jgi:hypothetical protein
MPANEYVLLGSRKSSTQVAFRGITSGWDFGEVNGVQSILNPFYCNKREGEHVERQIRSQRQGARIQLGNRAMMGAYEW